MLRRFGCALAVLVIALCTFALASCGTIRAGLMIRDALNPGPEVAEAIAETSEVIRCRAGPVPVRIYRPKDEDGPLPGVVLVHGAVETGASDGRLISLARAMAYRGGVVATPDLAALKAFRLDPLDPQRLADVAADLAARTDLVEDGQVAFVGISVGGSYGLVAAADPVLAGRVSTALCFGAYADLDGLLTRWMTDPRSDAPELLDPQTYGRRLVLKGNLSVLVPVADRAPVAAVLGRLLSGHPAGETPDGLDPAAERVVTVAISEGPVDPEVVAAMLAPLEPTIAALSPVRMKNRLDFPVYLLHGQRDPVVNVADLAVLTRHLETLDTEVEAHETDVFSHVNRMGDESPSLFSAWPLLSFVADAMSDAGF
jgi:pimeloyl-ACP methyl ester carboxylesterase